MAVSVIKAGVQNSKRISSTLVVPGNDITTVTITVNDAQHQLIKGFGVFNTANVVIIQCYFSSETTIVLRARNLISSQQTAYIDVYYC